MWNAFYWGLIATSSLVIGGFIGTRFKIGNKPLGLIMAFGAGVLISAVAYELTFEAVKLAKGSGYGVLGIFSGAFTFFFADLLIGRIGANNRKAISGEHKSNFALPIVLGTILDGIPESIVIGLGLLSGGKVSLAMLAAIFISNLPEAIAGTSGMVAGFWNRRKILLLWFIIAIVCSLASMAGYSLFANASHLTLSFIQAFAGGAILVMLSNTMVPEAYAHGGKLAGIFTVMGFSLAVLIVVLERVAEV
jgi:zinc transporter, ZIP family